MLFPALCRLALPGALALLTALAPVSGMAQDAAARADAAIRDAGNLTASGTNASAPNPTTANYRDALREIVMTLSRYAKGRDSGFQVTTREGLGLVTKSQRDAAIERLSDPSVGDDQRAVSPVGYAIRRYVRHLDGVVMDDQYCVSSKAEMTASDAFIEMLQDNSLVVLSVDHCSDSPTATDAWKRARGQSVIAHVDTLAGHTAEAGGGLQRVPGGRPLGENSAGITRLSEARNMLVLDGSAGYPDKEALVIDAARTNYDIIALSPFHRHSDPLTAAHVKALHYKTLGARRLVLARLNISQARDTAYFWQDAWKVGQPEWLLAPVPDDPGLYDVAFWHPEWRNILGRTFAGLMDLGYDGVMLEGAEAYRPLEAKAPLN